MGSLVQTIIMQQQRFYRYAPRDGLIKNATERVVISGTGPGETKTETFAAGTTEVAMLFPSASEIKGVR